MLRRIATRYRFATRLGRGLDDIIDNFTPINESQRRKIVLDSAVMAVRDPEKSTIEFIQWKTHIGTR